MEVINIKYNIMGKSDKNLQVRIPSSLKYAINKEALEQKLSIPKYVRIVLELSR